MKIPPVRAKLSHANRWTDELADVTKLKFAFRNLANAPKNHSNATELHNMTAVLTFITAVKI
jgi:hypothetical protein